MSETVLTYPDAQLWQLLGLPVPAENLESEFASGRRLNPDPDSSVLDVVLL